MRRQLVAFALMLALPVFAHAGSMLSATITTQAGKAIPLKLEMAVTPETRERGLMYRKSLKPADGMVFFFPQPAPYKFWMKNTLIPLDMLFVDEAGTVVYIATAKPLSLQPEGPSTNVDTVIEIDGGRAAREGITVGDTFTHAHAINPRSLVR